MGRLQRWVTRGYLESPVFVVGGGRSGTTVVTEALGTHPCLLAAPGESPIVTQLALVAARYVEGERSEWYAETCRLSTDELFTRLRELVFTGVFGSDLALRARARGAVKRAWRYRMPDLSLRPLRGWISKIFPGQETYPGLMALFPGARFLWIVRNGAAVVHSRTRFEGFRDAPFAEQCDAWTACIDQHSFLGGLPNALALRHEDLVADPQALFRQAQQFLGLPHSERPARMAATTHVHPLDKGTAAGVNVRQRLAKRGEPWLAWSDEQQATFKARCGEAMRVAGYPLPF
jgi:Sulfotransferase family